jgi:hypothetical protein
MSHRTEPVARRTRPPLRLESLEGRALPGDSLLGAVLGGSLLGAGLAPAEAAAPAPVSGHARLGEPAAQAWQPTSLAGNPDRAALPAPVTPADQAPLAEGRGPDTSAPFPAGAGGGAIGRNPEAAQATFLPEAGPGAPPDGASAALLPLTDKGKGNDGIPPPLLCGTVNLYASRNGDWHIVINTYLNYGTMTSGAFTVSTNGIAASSDFRGIRNAGYRYQSQGHLAFTGFGANRTWAEGFVITSTGHVCVFYVQQPW